MWMCISEEMDIEARQLSIIDTAVMRYRAKEGIQQEYRGNKYLGNNYMCRNYNSVLDCLVFEAQSKLRTMEKPLYNFIVSDITKLFFKCKG